MSILLGMHWRLWDATPFLPARGWDVGFASMSVGEKAVLELKPSYGYGAEGAGGVIPGNATLFFEVRCPALAASPMAAMGGSLARPTRYPMLSPVAGRAHVHRLDPRAVRG